MNINVPGHKIIRLIGTGSMGMVYLAIQPALRREVALKALYPHHAKNRERRERFFNEARLMANLVHPNIVQLYNLIESEGNIIIVMEYIDGRNMDEMIGSEYGPLVVEKAMPLITDILKGLGYAHSQNIVHRDIKPGNVLVSNNHVAKVMDFGIAKLLSQKGLTKAGAQIGTLAYMSPEQVLGADVDQRSDIYSLGMTLYEMIAGKLPSDDYDMNDMDFMNMVLKERLPDPRDYYPHIPEWMVALTYKAIEKKQEDRFQSCEEFLYELERGFATGSVSVKLKKPFFFKISSTIKNLFSPPQRVVPSYFDKDSSSGGIEDSFDASSGFAGETLEQREERKRQQLAQLLGKKSKSAEPYESSLHEETRDEIEKTSEIAAEFNREFKEHYPEAEIRDVNDSAIEDDTESQNEVIEGDPVDSDNELSFWVRNKGKVIAFVATLCVLVLAFKFVPLGKAIEQPATDSDSVSVEPFEPYFAIEEINTAGVITESVKDAAVSENGDLIFLTSDELSIFYSDSISWNSVEIQSIGAHSVSFMRNRGVSCSLESKKMQLYSMDLEKTGTIDFELYSPASIYWTTDSLMNCVVPVYESNVRAGSSISKFNFSGDLQSNFNDYTIDISGLSGVIPIETQYFLYYENVPIVAFQSDSSVFVTSYSGLEYKIEHFILELDSIGELNSVLIDELVRDYSGTLKSDIQITEERNNFTELMGEEPPENWPTEIYLPVIDWLGVDGEKRLWVHLGNTEEETFDIYSPDGVFIQTVHPDLPEDLDWNYRMAGSNILAYANNEVGVKAYLLEYIDSASDLEE